MVNSTDKNTERRLRRVLQKHGYKLRKLRESEASYSWMNNPGYMITRNDFIEAGEPPLTLGLDDVEKWCAELEAGITG